jgi:hypothetical protein
MSRRFHGTSQHVVRSGRKAFVVIGQLQAVEYTTPEPSVKAGVLWRHHLGDWGDRKTTVRPLLVADPVTGEVKILKGRSGLKFDPDRGLVG